MLAAGLTTGLGITTSTAVEARGWFSPIDDATQDFVALSVTNRDTAPSAVLIADRVAGLVVTPSASQGTFTIEVTGSTTAGEIAVVDRGFVGATPLPSAPPFSLLASPMLGFYGVRQRQTGTVTWMLDFEAFVTRLETELALGAELFNFGALGSYDAGTNALTAGLCLVVLD